jgi:serine/threonine protein kinase
LVLVYPFEHQCLREYAKEPLTLFEIQRVMYQILKGISVCHRAGVIHRNLKSDNILIGQDGLVKISDFASSRISNIPIGNYTPEDPKERDRSGREAKRLWYRAPELLYRTKCYTFETDMWSIGCLLAEVARGIPLFNGQSEIESLFKIFRLTGSPESEQTGSQEVNIVAPKWKRIPFTHVLGQESEINELIEAFIPQRESAFKILVELKHKLGLEGLDLLQRLLDLNPRRRISAEQALRHKFFDQQRYLDCDQLPPLLAESYTVIKFGCTDAYIETSFDFLRKQDLWIGRKHVSKNEQITTQMRMVLVDWLLDVAVHFDLKFETLHLAVSYVQRFLSLASHPVDRANLQLVGVASMKIADAFNERSREYYRQENALEYSNITAQEFTPAEVLNMEKCILSTLGFQLCQGTLISYVELFN